MDLCSRYALGASLSSSRPGSQYPSFPCTHVLTPWVKVSTSLWLSLYLASSHHAEWLRKLEEHVDRLVKLSAIRFLLSPISLPTAVVVDSAELFQSAFGTGVTRLKDSPASESHIVPVWDSRVRLCAFAGHPSAISSSTAVFTTSWLASSSAVSASCWLIAVSRSTCSAQLKLAQTVRPLSASSMMRRSRSSLLSSRGPRSWLRRKRPSSSRRRTSNPYCSRIARASSSRRSGSPPANLTSIPPCASPTLKNAASRRCKSSRSWAMAITLSGTVRNEPSCPTNVAGRSALLRKSSNASRRMRQTLPNFMHGRRPSLHHR